MTELIRMPKKGKQLQIVAHGQTAILSKCERDRTWRLIVVSAPGTRYGGAADMRRDIRIFKATGSLPPKPGNIM